MWLSQNMVPESVNELNMTHVYIKHTYIGENTNILAECFLTKFILLQQTFTSNLYDPDFWNLKLRQCPR